MPVSVRKAITAVLGGFTVIFSLLPLVESSREDPKLIQSHKTSKSDPLELTPQVSFQIRLHAFLLWASVGFLMPFGILLIRMSSRDHCGRKLKLLFYSHVIVQLMALFLATAGAILSVKNFANTFNNTHQRIGLALYALIWIQPLITCVRPHRGVKIRSIWYIVHWLLGIGICILGITNIYIGLHTYHKKTSRSVRLWSILFTTEVVIIALIYLFQDRWDYMIKQGVVLGDEQVRPTTHLSSPTISQKELPTLPPKRQKMIHLLAQSM